MLGLGAYESSSEDETENKKRLPVHHVCPIHYYMIMDSTIQQANSFSHRQGKRYLQMPIKEQLMVIFPEL